MLVDRGVDVFSLLQQVRPQCPVVPCWCRLDKSVGELRGLARVHELFLSRLCLGRFLGSMPRCCSVLLVLLVQFGIVVDSTGQKVGTVALAYAAHKAASPIRFPPTVLLTPIVATLFGRAKQKEDKSTWKTCLPSLKQNAWSACEAFLFMHSRSFYKGSVWPNSLGNKYNLQSLQRLVNKRITRINNHKAFPFLMLRRGTHHAKLWFKWWAQDAFMARL